jgi:hypothetical protein
MEPEAVMKGQLLAENRFTHPLFLVLTLLLGAVNANAQVPVDSDGNPLASYPVDGEPGAELYSDPSELLTVAELEELVGPVALYPDDLLAIVLPASAYPLEIVQAARFLEAFAQDSTLKPDEDWDDSVIALLNYPDVIRMLDEEIDWTWRLGEAVISQQNDVIAAVESFRDRAYAAGNLKSDENQKVSVEEGIIEIVPVSEEIIHVPYYEPAEVVVQQARPVYHYYPDPYPVYYYPYPVDYRFRSGYFWGVTTAFSIGWSNHYLHVRHPSYWGHPYYGRYYYGHYYRRPSITVYNNYYVRNSYRSAQYRHRDGDYWRPRHRAGSRPNEPRVVNRHYSPGSSSGARNRSATVTNYSRVDTGTGSSQRRNTVNSSRSNDRVTTNRTTTNRTTTNRASVNSNRSTDPQPTIRFRDRDNTQAVSNRANTVTAPTRRATNTRSASDRDRRISTAVRQPSASVSPRTAPRTTAPAVRQPTSRAPRATAPTNREPRTSGPSVRQTAPRSAAPAIRQAPRSGSAPTRSTPPRSTPTRSAPARSAPSSRTSSRSEPGTSSRRRSNNERN